MGRKSPGRVLLKMQATEASEITRLTWVDFMFTREDQRPACNMSTPSPQRQGVLCPKLGGPVCQAVSSFTKQEFHLQNLIASAPSTVPNPQQCPIKCLLN